MSHYDELPVYKASYDLLLAVFQFTKHFAKEYKYTVGEKLKNEMIDFNLLNMFVRTIDIYVLGEKFIDQSIVNIIFCLFFSHVQNLFIICSVIIIFNVVFLHFY